MSAVRGTGDQADTLRQMARTAKQNSQNAAAPAQLTDQQGIRVISVTSGKGGVGKSNVVANLAMALAAQGKKVLIIDGDLGVGNLDVLLGLSPQYNLNHVLSGEKSLAEIIVEVTPSINPNGTTTSRVHTADKIHPNYARGQAVHVLDASRAVPTEEQERRPGYVACMLPSGPSGNATAKPPRSAATMPCSRPCQRR